MVSMNDMPPECPLVGISYSLWNIQLWVHKAPDGCLGFNIYELNIYHDKGGNNRMNNLTFSLAATATSQLWSK